MQIIWGVGGMAVLLLIAFAASTNPRSIRPRTVLGALVIQVVFAFLVLRSTIGQRVLEAASSGVQSAIDAASKGVDFLAGPLNSGANAGKVVAFTVLPSIIFVAMLSAILYHWGVMQWVVRIIGGGLRKVLGTARAESLNATANIFLGQTEAPLLVRPYLQRMTVSEFFAVMTGGLSTVSGGVMAGYAQLGANLENLIAAAFMAAPAGLLFAKIIVPETEHSPDVAAEQRERAAARAGSSATRAGSGPGATGDTGAGTSDSAHNTGPDHTEGTGESAANADSGTSASAEPAEDTEAVEEKPRNVIDAAAQGTTDGLRLALNVGAMLLGFIALIALINTILGGVGSFFGLPDITLQQLLGYVFAPVMFVIGVPWHEAVAAASFVGEKLVLNEFIAFSDFGPKIAQFSTKTATIITFALTGFANFSSLGILLGGLGGLVPRKRSWIAKYGMRAILAGTLANLMSATIAGILTQ